MREAPEALELAERACRAAEGDEADALVHAERSGFARYRGLAGAPADPHRGPLGHDPRRPRRAHRLRLDEPDRRRGARRGGRPRGRDRRPRCRSIRPFPACPSRRASRRGGLGRGDGRSSGPASRPPARGRRSRPRATSGSTGTSRAASPSSRRPRRRALAVSQATTDVNVLALAAADGRSGYADAAVVEGRRRRSCRGRARGRGEGRADRRGAADPGRPPTAPSSSPTPSASSSGTSATARSARSPSSRSGATSPAGSASASSTRRSRSTTTLATRAGLPKAFDFEGVPKQRVAIVEDGVVKDVVWDRRTAARAGRESTGHALAAPAQSYGPQPFNLSVPAGDASVDELVARVSRTAST